MLDRRILTQSQRKLVFLSLLMLFLETHPGSGGSFSLRLITNAEYCRYDFVLKNTVISESVRTCSRVRALWGKRVKGMHYSFWLFKKKHILYIISFSILMKVYLYCFFPPIDWFTRSLDEEFINIISCCVFAQRKQEITFVIQLKLFHSVRAWMCKRVNISTHSLTSCHSVYSIALFVEHFFCVGVTPLQAGLVKDTPGFTVFTLVLNQCHLSNILNHTDHKHDLNQERYNELRGECKMCDKYIYWNGEWKAYNKYCFVSLKHSHHSSTAQVHVQREKKVRVLDFLRNQTVQSCLIRVASR